MFRLPQAKTALARVRSPCHSPASSRIRCRSARAFPLRPPFSASCSAWRTRSLASMACSRCDLLLGRRRLKVETDRAVRAAALETRPARGDLRGSSFHSSPESAEISRFRCSRSIRLLKPASNRRRSSQVLPGGEDRGADRLRLAIGDGGDLGHRKSLHGMQYEHFTVAGPRRRPERDCTSRSISSEEAMSSGVAARRSAITLSLVRVSSG